MHPQLLHILLLTSAVAMVARQQSEELFLLAMPSIIVGLRSPTGV